MVCGTTHSVVFKRCNSNAGAPAPEAYKRNPMEEALNKKNGGNVKQKSNGGGVKQRSNEGSVKKKSNGGGVGTKVPWRRRKKGSPMEDAYAR